VFDLRVQSGCCSASTRPNTRCIASTWIQWGCIRIPHHRDSLYGDLWSDSSVQTVMVYLSCEFHALLHMISKLVDKNVGHTWKLTTSRSICATLHHVITQRQPLMRTVNKRHFKWESRLKLWHRVCFCGRYSIGN
jgi:hypothetical protein